MSLMKLILSSVAMLAFSSVVLAASDSYPTPNCPTGPELRAALIAHPFLSTPRMLSNDYGWGIENLTGDQIDSRKFWDVDVDVPNTVLKENAVSYAIHIVGSPLLSPRSAKARGENSEYDCDYDYGSRKGLPEGVTVRMWRL